MFVLDPGYTLQWDNVQLDVEVKHQKKEDSSKMLLWANAFASRNRVPFRNLDSHVYTVPATSIPVTAFLPSEDDYKSLRSRMEILVGRILVKHLGHFKEHYSSFSEEHIKHPYWKESCKRSELV